MRKTRTPIVFIMILAVLALQAGSAYAAPAYQTSTVTGTVKSVAQSTDSSGNTVFIVTFLDANGKLQTASLSAAEAVSLGLVTDNHNGTFTINNVLGSEVSFPSTVVAANPCNESEKGMVASALAAFFCQGGSTVLDNTVDALHADGFGFGEIAQACFMAQALQTTCGEILNAKKSRDFGSLGLPSDVKNWGQLKKYALGQEIKSLTNLGAIMSGRATAPATNATPTTLNPLFPGAGNDGNGNGQGHGNGHGNGHGHGHGNKP